MTDDAAPNGRAERASTRVPFSLSCDPLGRLVLIDAQGRRHVGVHPVRSFPISDPDNWIVLLDDDGREVAVIPELAGLPDGLKATLAAELAMREFVPVIERIIRVAGETLPTEWQVETDRGPTRFILADEDHLRKLGANRILIADAHGNRYLVQDTTALDAASRRYLERYL